MMKLNLSLSPRFLSALGALVCLAPCFAAAAEQPVAPYSVSDANAGAAPALGSGLYEAFHGREGVARVVADLIGSSRVDPRISDIFKAADFERLQRTLTEQVCYLLGGDVHYTGRDMSTAHKDMGLQTRDLNILIEHLQVAMDHEHVAFGAQNRLLALLAPMKSKVVSR